MYRVVDSDSSPEYFPVVDWQWKTLKAKEMELLAKEDALKAKDKEIFEVSSKGKANC